MEVQEAGETAGICVECISGIFAGLFWGEAVENKCETYKKSDE